MTPSERLMSDYSGTASRSGRIPLALRRMELAMRGVLRAIDLPRGRHGRRVRVAGAVITRQRPGTAKGFVFLTLEDETGIANIIVRPDLFSDQRADHRRCALPDGRRDSADQEGVTSVKAERLVSLGGEGPEPQSHDFRWDAKAEAFLLRSVAHACTLGLDARVAPPSCAWRQSARAGDGLCQRRAGARPYLYRWRSLC